MKVAIIGAGFSGMYAAYLLEQKGFEVTVFEKEERIGGHCKTISTKDVYTEIGTIFSFSGKIKELLIKLKVEYKERFIYRNFVDADYNEVEYMKKEDILLLMEELNRLKLINETYKDSLDGLTYNIVDDDLKIPFSDFAKKKSLNAVAEVIRPLLSSFGFGSIDEIMTYYVLKVFTVETIYAFIKGEKLLYLDKGMSELIRRLSQKISDIRYSQEVESIEVIDKQAVVKTAYSSDSFDHCLITTKLPSNVIKDEFYSLVMNSIDTNPFVACAYEVDNNDLVTTYFKSHLGQKNKVQFFHACRQSGRSVVIAYAYGTLDKKLVKSITKDLEKTGLNIKHLITSKQWHIFPHIKFNSFAPNLYSQLHKNQADSPIKLIGSLITEPNIDQLYQSVDMIIDSIINDSK